MADIQVVSAHTPLEICEEIELLNSIVQLMFQRAVTFKFDQNMVERIIARRTRSVGFVSKMINIFWLIITFRTP